MKTIIPILLFFFTFSLLAADKMEIQDATIRSTPPGMNMSVIFFKVLNHTSEPIKLVMAEGLFAKKFELHNMEMLQGKMIMRPVTSILINSNSSTELKSGGFHIMVFDILKPIKKGEIYNIKLIFDNEKIIETKVLGN